MGSTESLNREKYLHLTSFSQILLGPENTLSLGFLLCEIGIGLFSKLGGCGVGAQFNFCSIKSLDIFLKAMV